MTTTTAQLERERLLKLAQEYREKGYEVLLPERPEDLPDFLKDYCPDMIVRRGTEAVVVEVKSLSSIASAQYLRDLAQAVENHPGWRLELVMTNPDDVAYSVKAEGSLQEKEIESRLQIARELTNQHPESAILYTWSLTEATLRLVTKKEGLSLQKPDPLHLLKQLATEGVISKSDYQSLMNALLIRNAIAHGFKTTQITQSSVYELIDITEQLLNSLYNNDEPL
ncbi:hypothetical protein QUB80_24915 [Chlorogloeopsis sp. ULAP01]|uniref:hypothetical protein n=1 Tax=Chlorogloeopsis sp. ULAP01 TaxID=3056483 RepID=UPI0025AAF91D|nr:hypothetical protein [Chlorogloeopsis sp. ULAP01]MDM9383927.1 hypothetical protein [Chlorogloeopsis sp. ULAP01]